MTRAFLTPVSECAKLRDALQVLVPQLETERLILRVPRLEDWDTIEPIWLSNRGQYIGGPFNEEDAWLDFSQAVAGWLLRGIGYWTIVRKSDELPLGLIGVGQETTDPELEFGWLLTQEAEGQGYAFEAGQAVHEHLFKSVGLTTAVSMIHKKNTRSIALAQRLGATEDADAVPAAFQDEDTAYRHHPGQTA